MAINNISELEKALRLEEGTLKAALDNEEIVDVQIPELKTFTLNEFDSYQERYREDQRKTALEMAVKDKRNSLGLDFQGKTVDNLLSSYKDKVLAEAEIEPSRQITELNSEKEGLLNKIGTIQSELDSTKHEWKTEKQNTFITSSIKKALPGEDKLSIPHDDIITLFRARNSNLAVNDESKIIFSKGESFEKDELLQPISLQSKLDTFLSPYINKPTGGSAGGDSTNGSGKQDMDSFIKEMNDAGNNPSSDAFTTEMSARLTAGTLDI